MKVGASKGMTDDELAAELNRIGDRWDALRKSVADEGMAGSPGEGLWEWMNEIETEQKRRAASLKTAEHT